MPRGIPKNRRTRKDRNTARRARNDRVSDDLVKDALKDKTFRLEMIALLHRAMEQALMSQSPTASAARPANQGGWNRCHRS
jgi:hypothetical protein